MISSVTEAGRLTELLLVQLQIYQLPDEQKRRDFNCLTTQGACIVNHLDTIKRQEDICASSTNQESSS